MPSDFDFDQLTLKTLKSQYESIFASQAYTMVAGGWGCGKTHAACIKGLVLSFAYPGNLGLIGRFNATDLQDSTMVNFFEVCPRSWIKSYNKQRKWVTLKNGSQIVFRHLNDPNPKRSHIAGMNLGWFFIDQAEECGIEHWTTLCGRLRRPQARRRFGFGTMNPNGKDDFYELFFSKPVTSRINDFANKHEYGDLLGITVRSDENKKSNGGFVDDEYFVGLRQNMSPEWVARYLDCSFEDFSGKIYKEFTLDSVHNVEPFSIPRHWNTIVGIDVGGSAPWGICVGRIDDFGNIIWTNEFYKPEVNIATVVNWIKYNTQNWNDADNIYVIDWENKLAMLELNENGIIARPAQKAVRPGIIRTGGYLHVNKTQPLPPWYTQLQPSTVSDKFSGKGSPRMFFFNNLSSMRKEFDTYQWDLKKINKPLKENDHLCDAVRYAVMARPMASQLRPMNEKREELRRMDPGTAAFWDSYDKRVEQRIAKQQGKLGLSTELFGETDRNTLSGDEDEPLRSSGVYDWAEGQ